LVENQKRLSFGRKSFCHAIYSWPVNG